MSVITAFPQTNHSEPRKSSESTILLRRKRGKKLSYKSVAKEISKPPFLAPEVQWASKFTVLVWFIHPRPYLVCHVTTIENVLKLGLSESSRNITISFAKRQHCLQLVACVWGNVQYFENYRSLSAFMSLLKIYNFRLVVKFLLP